MRPVGVGTCESHSTAALDLRTPDAGEGEKGIGQRTTSVVVLDSAHAPRRRSSRRTRVRTELGVPQRSEDCRLSSADGRLARRGCRSPVIVRTCGLRCQVIDRGIPVGLRERVLPRGPKRGTTEEMRVASPRGHVVAGVALLDSHDVAIEQRTGGAQLPPGGRRRGRGPAHRWLEDREHVQALQRHRRARLPDAGERLSAFLTAAASVAPTIMSLEHAPPEP